MKLLLPEGKNTSLHTVRVSSRKAPLKCRPPHPPAFRGARTAQRARSPGRREHLFPGHLPASPGRPRFRAGTEDIGQEWRVVPKWEDHARVGGSRGSGRIAREWEGHMGVGESRESGRVTREWESHAGVGRSRGSWRVTWENRAGVGGGRWALGRQPRPVVKALLWAPDSALAVI